MIEEPCKSAHLAAMEAAKKAGCILSYDPNLRLPLWPSAEAARTGIMSIWDQADFIKVHFSLLNIAIPSTPLKRIRQPRCFHYSYVFVGISDK